MTVFNASPTCIIYISHLHFIFDIIKVEASGFRVWNCGVGWKEPVAYLGALGDGPHRLAHPNFLQKNLQTQCMDVRTFKFDNVLV